MVHLGEWLLGSQEIERSSKSFFQAECSMVFIDAFDSPNVVCNPSLPFAPNADTKALKTGAAIEAR